MTDVPNGFYRTSIKALILNESRDKFLIVKEENGKWELPGGALDWGESVGENIKREIKEEMGLEVIQVADSPSYFITSKANNGTWIANVLFETKIETLDFTPSYECVDVTFVDKNDVSELDLFSNVELLLNQFNPRNHL